MGIESSRISSPVMSGFQAFGTISAVNEATAATAASTIQKPRMWSVAAKYDNGPLGLGVTYSQHKDYNPAAQTTYTGGRDSSWLLAAGYKFMGTLQLWAQYVHLDYQLAAGRGMTQNNWHVTGQWDIAGPHFIRAGYVAIGNTKGTAGAPGALIRVGSMNANGGAGDTGGSKILFEYGYNLSKRTELTLGYGKQSNDRFSSMSVGTGSNTGNLGESQTYFGGRFSHRF